MPMFPIPHDFDKSCPHCVVAKCLNEFRPTPECKSFIVDNQEANRTFKKCSEDTMAALGMIQGMGALIGELLGTMAPEDADRFLDIYTRAVDAGLSIGQARRRADERETGAL